MARRPIETQRDLGILRFLERVGHSRELLDQSGPGLRVQSLSIAALAHLDGCRDMDEDETSAGLDGRADISAGLVIRGDRGTDGDPAGLRDLGGHETNAAHIDIAVLLGEAQAR